MKVLVIAVLCAVVFGIGLSTPAQASAQAPHLAAVNCTHTYQSTVHTGGFPNWSEVKWTDNSCGFVIRGVSQCYGGKPVHHVTGVGGWVHSTGLNTRAPCPSGEPFISRAGYDIETTTGYNRTWYWP